MHSVGDRPGLCHPIRTGKVSVLLEAKAQSKQSIKKGIVAPRVGFEPTTDRLTVDCSTAELSGNSSERAIAQGFAVCKGEIGKICSPSQCGENSLPSGGNAACRPRYPLLTGRVYVSSSKASWRSGYAEDCKSLHPGSIPGEASKLHSLPNRSFLKPVPFAPLHRYRGFANYGKTS